MEAIAPILKETLVSKSVLFLMTIALLSITSILTLVYIMIPNIKKRNPIINIDSSAKCAYGMAPKTPMNKLTNLKSNITINLSLKKLSSFSILDSFIQKTNDRSNRAKYDENVTHS